MDLGLTNQNGNRVSPRIDRFPGGASEPQRAAAAFEALLLGAALKPLAASFGFFGETLIDSVASSVAQRSHDALSAHLASLFEDAH